MEYIKTSKNWMKKRNYAEEQEFIRLQGVTMSEQPTCQVCKKPYYKNHPEDKSGCNCDPDKRVVVKTI